MAIEEIYILHHTHVDVGYTDVQWQVRDLHVEYLAQALDHCARTDDYPDDARFRWISEFSWPVVEFLRARPERAEELFARLREGRVELCGLFVDPTELHDRRGFEMSLRPALDLAGEHGFAVTCAMTTDIPGQGWGLADVLAEQGLPWLSVSPNSMVSKPIEVERPFRWIGPRGGSVLVWLTDWRKGWYGEGHVLRFRDGHEAMRAHVTEYLAQLQSEGYPWRALALHFAADNFPPSAELPDLVRAWNDAGDLPRMRIATNREFFERMAALHGGEFAQHRLAWPDWWSEGVGSAAYETGLSRATHCQLARIEALQARLGDQRDLWPIWEDLLLFDEHTFGCSNMAVNPHSFTARATWAHKSSCIYRAHDRARRLEAELAAALQPDATPAAQADHRDATVAAAGPSAGRVTLFNPLTEAFHGPAALAGLAPEATALVGPDGATVPVQRSAATPLAEAQAWAVIALEPGEVRALEASSGDVPAAAPGDEGAERIVLQSEHYRLSFERTGRLASLIDLASGVEQLDARAPWGFAETIHERITSAEDRAAIWERGYLTIPYGKRRTDANFARTGALAEAELVGVETGPVFASLTWRSRLPFVRALETEVRLWRGLRRIDVTVRLDKQPCEEYDALYVAFPFAMDPPPRAFVHSCDAVFEAEAEQLPGSCRDYYAVEHFAALQAEGWWAQVTPIEASLVQLGEITFGRWADRLRITRGAIYAWLTNNFWYTNFPGYQLGRLSFSFALTTGAGALDPDAATAFGRAARVGLTVA